MARCASLPSPWIHGQADPSARDNADVRVRYLKVIDKFYNNYISCFLTGGSMTPTHLHHFSRYNQC